MEGVAFREDVMNLSDAQKQEVSRNCMPSMKGPCQTTGYAS